MLSVSGCGFVADKDRIVVATLDGENITRGDLTKILREMPDEERPLIQNKGDLLRALNGYIDEQIKADLAAELYAEGKINVDREVARASYLQAHPEFASAYSIHDPTQLGMTRNEVEAVKASVEFGIDDEVEKLLRDEAVAYEMHEAVNTHALNLTAEDIRREYDARKNTLIKYETLEFIAMVFPVDTPDAEDQAVRARRRLDAGETFDDVLAELMRTNPDAGIQPVMQNDPTNERFRAFWQTAHGADVGQILGPLVLPEHRDVGQDEDGRVVTRIVPPAYVVLKVVAHEPERLKTFEEAAQDIGTSLLRRFVMDQLRADHGVEVYEDKLPDPAGFGDQYKDSMIDTGRPVAQE
jgi:hypothetical protein